MQSHSFSELGLSEALVAAVTREGYTQPTDIQAQAIPTLLTGVNLLGTAQTGTGKTAAFTLPLLHILMSTGREDGNDLPVGNAESASRSGTGHGRGGHAGRDAGRSTNKNRGRSGPARPRALILAPTRELAIQIDTSVATYGRGSGISHLAVFGGAPKGRQLEGLRRNPVVLTATPGRLQDFISEHAIDLSGVEFLILDEADRMLDMGFIPEVRRIAAMVANRKQTALFSATMPVEIEHLAEELLGTNAARVAIAPRKVVARGIKQSVFHMNREDKISFLPDLIKERGMFRVLVFTRTKHRAARVSKILSKAGIPSDEIHGNRTQNQRQRALESFRRGRIQALVGTDVAARGIDVDDITHVINYEIPNEPETYVHRIGRTARAGMEGEALSFCDREELQDFRRIEALLGGAVDVDANHVYHQEPPAPQRKRSNGGPNRGGGQSRRNGGGRPGGNGFSGGGRDSGGGRRSNGRAARPRTR